MAADFSTAEAIEFSFNSEAVTDSAGEPANVVDAIADLAESIRFAANRLGLGEAEKPMGAVEVLAQSITQAADTVAHALGDVADAIRTKGS